MGARERPRGLRCADIEAAVNERGVHAHDFHGGVRGQAQRPVALADAGGTGEDEHRQLGLQRGHYRPRRNNWSSCCSVRRVQVGRPWLH